MEGSHEFFEAIGFRKVTLPVPDQGEKVGRWEGAGTVRRTRGQL